MFRLFLMTLDAQRLAVTHSIRTTLVKWNDVIHFEVAFRIRFVALPTGEVISLEDAESLFCSASSFEAVCDWFPGFRYSNRFHISGPS